MSGIARVVVFEAVITRDVIRTDVPPVIIAPSVLRTFMTAIYSSVDVLVDGVSIELE